MEKLQHCLRKTPGPAFLAAVYGAVFTGNFPEFQKHFIVN